MAGELNGDTYIDLIRWLNSRWKTWQPYRNSACALCATFGTNRSVGESRIAFPRLIQ